MTTDISNQQNILPLNKHLENFKHSKETGIVPGSGQYSIYTRSINSSNWAGRIVNFTVNTLGLNRLIIGNKCYLSFKCRATKSDDGSISNLDGIELRDNASGLILQNTRLDLAGSQIYNDTYSFVTNHWYEHLNNSNSARTANLYQSVYIDPEEKSFSTGEFQFSAGNRQEAIISNNLFKINRNLNEIPFFGPRDSSIPSSLPVDMEFTLNTNPSRLFNCLDTVLASPKLIIESVELYIYSVEMQQEFSSTVNQALQTETLSAMSDFWSNRNVSPNVSTAQTQHTSNDQIFITNQPDVLGICYFPEATFNKSVNSWKGFHPMRTSWLNTNNINIFNNGSITRNYRDLGSNTEVGGKDTLYSEIKNIQGTSEMSGQGNFPIDGNVFSSGRLSFFPILNRSIFEDSVVQPSPSVFTFTSQFKSSAGEDALCFAFYKTRHLYRLSTIVGQTQVIK